jgi:CHASE2 domain-containing sensor protein
MLNKILSNFNQDQRFTALVLFVLAILLALSGLLSRFDHIFYDVGRYFSFKEAPDDIVIIAIDERSLDAIGKWPWSRKTHAQLLQKLSPSQAKVIGLDIFFSEPDLSHPEEDAGLAATIKQLANVVLPVIIETPFQGAKIQHNASMPLLADRAAAVGRVNVPLDSDGIARGIYLWEGVSANQTNVLGLPLFAYSVLQVADRLPSDFLQTPPLIEISAKNKQLQRFLARFDEKRIQFYGPPGHFKQISYVNVLSGEVPAVYFKDKIVLIGATAVGMGDVLATPVSGFSRPMSGVEFHANVIESMRQSQLVSIAPLWLTGLLCAFLSIIPTLWLPKVKPLHALLMILLYLTVLIIGSLALPQLLHVWVAPSSALLMVLLAYPLWSWRRLDSAQSFLDVELQHLKNDLIQFGLRPVNSEVLDPQANKASYLQRDIFQSRILEVQFAAQLLRDLQKNRNDTLAFISHDIRMPLATALMLLKEQDFAAQKSRIVQMLDRANTLAENFLQISKAETASLANFKELELNGLMQESTDNVYHLARSKSIKFNMVLSEEPLWVQGDFGLLHRAFVNILLNAVKYSPESTQVDVHLAQQQGQAIVVITDHGYGIPAERIPQLFKRFSRLEETYQTVEGSGLGLYFVDVTIKKHQGRIDVASKLGQWTTFTLTLPIIN